MRKAASIFAIAAIVATMFSTTVMASAHRGLVLVSKTGGQELGHNCLDDAGSADCTWTYPGNDIQVKLTGGADGRINYQLNRPHAGDPLGSFSVDTNGTCFGDMSVYASTSTYVRFKVVFTTTPAFSPQTCRIDQIGAIFG